MEILSSEVTLYLYKSTIRPCMECCCHVWDDASSYYIEMLDKLKNRYVGLLLLHLRPLLKPLIIHRDEVSLSLFYGYRFGK